MSERCTDPWLQAVQEETRYGKLCKDNHSFLHGKPTSVLGSWVRGDVSCGQQRCRDMVDPMLNEPLKTWATTPKRKSAQCSPAYILKHECEVCRKERTSKNRVARGAEDERFHSEKISTPQLSFRIMTSSMIPVRLELIASRKSAASLHHTQWRRTAPLWKPSGNARA